MRAAGIQRDIRVLPGGENEDKKLTRDRVAKNNHTTNDLPQVGIGSTESR